MSTRRRVVQTLVGFALLILGVCSCTYGWFEPFAVLPLLALVVIIDAVFPTPENPHVERLIAQQATFDLSCNDCRVNEVEVALRGGACPQCGLQAIHRAMTDPAQPRSRRPHRRSKANRRWKRNAYSLTPPTLRPRLTQDLRCSFCRDRLASGEHRACPDCNTLLHEACWFEGGGCVTLGCDALGSSTAPYHRAQVAERVLERSRA